MDYLTILQYARKGAKETINDYITFAGDNNTIEGMLDHLEKDLLTIENLIKREIGENEK